MRTFIVLVATLLAAPLAVAQGTPENEPKLYSGPAFQYEGKWAAQLQTAATGTLIETVTTCANPLVLVARDGSTLVRSDGGLISVMPVDRDTIGWSEDGHATIVTPSRDGNFIALTPRDATGALDHGRIVSYLRCGTAGQTAADQVCVAN